MTKKNDPSLDLYINAILGRKATDVVVLDVANLTSYADIFIICSGRSNRQVSAIADFIKTELKSELDQYFEGSVIEEKYSSSGKYTSITVTKKMNSAEEVLDIYAQISKIPGVISL